MKKGIGLGSLIGAACTVALGLGFAWGRMYAEAEQCNKSDLDEYDLDDENDLFGGDE